MSRKKTPASDGVRDFVPGRVEIPARITFQVTALGMPAITSFRTSNDDDDDDDDEEDDDDDYVVARWSNLAHGVRRKIRADLGAQLGAFTDWMANDQKFIDAGGAFVLDDATYASDDLSMPPVVCYAGRFVLSPRDSMAPSDVEPSIYVRNISQSRNMVAEMVAGVFAHYEYAGDDSLTLVSIEFPLPHRDLHAPWRAMDRARSWLAARQNEMKQKNNKVPKKEQAQQQQPQTKKKDGKKKKKRTDRL